MIREPDEVALTCDLPEQKLAAGDIGTFVLVHGERAAGVMAGSGRPRGTTLYLARGIIQRPH